MNKTTDEIAVIAEKPYTFRKLGSEDLFLMFKIISAIGIDNFTKCLSSASVMEAVKNMSDKEKAEDSGAMLAFGAVALEVVNVILNNIGKCKNEIYQLLANTSNMTVEEISAEGNAVLFLEMVIDFCKKEEFPNFIQVVSRLFK
jgi:hypothetical protein